MIPLELVPTVGDEVLAKVFDGIYRVEVIEVLDDEELETKIIVQLIDVGCTTEIKLEVRFFKN
jgi:hypothetical protein